MINLISEIKKVIIAIFSLLASFHYMHGLIRIECFFKSPYYFSVLREAASELQELGVYIVNNHDSDVILTDNGAFDFENCDRPIIFLDSIDAAVVPTRLIRHLSNPKIKAIFKTYTLRPITLNLLPRFADCYHFALVNNYFKFGQNQNPPIIEKQYFEKIRCVVCMNKHSIRSKYDALKREPLDLIKERPIDVFFVGSTSYNIFSEKVKKAYSTHRLAAIDAIKKIKNINSFILQQTRGSLPFREYMGMIKKSKIVVSPWGWGEFCYRDFEAILGGAILVKPDSSFIETRPDIYQNYKTYIPCKPDFSDLKSIILEILGNYSTYDEMRRYARDLLVSYNREHFARDFAHAVKAVLC